VAYVNDVVKSVRAADKLGKSDGNTSHIHLPDFDAALVISALST
jgi:hypothetical protein